MTHSISSDVPIARPRRRSLLDLNRVLRIVLPLALFVAILWGWESYVVHNNVPPYILPAPSAIWSTLIKDWPVLSASLLVTLTTTLEGLVLAVVGGVTLAVLLTALTVVFAMAVLVAVTAGFLVAVTVVAITIATAILLAVSVLVAMAAMGAAGVAVTIASALMVAVTMAAAVTVAVSLTTAFARRRGLFGRARGLAGE